MKREYAECNKFKTSEAPISISYEPVNTTYNHSTKPIPTREKVEIHSMGSPHNNNQPSQAVFEQASLGTVKLNWSQSPRPQRLH